MVHEALVAAMEEMREQCAALAVPLRKRRCPDGGWFVLSAAPQR